MASLTDVIEAYIRALIDAGEGMAEIQRTVVAEEFRCAPSQISYVISSRFSPERGYIIESRRGGGGFIRLTKVELGHRDLREMMGGVGPYLSQNEAHDHLARLWDEGFIDERAFRVMRAATSRNALAMTLPGRDEVRANVFKAMLNAYFSTKGSEES